jgi:hypothetical protein
VKAILNVHVGEIFENVNQILEWYEIEEDTGNEPMDVELQLFNRTDDMVLYRIVAGGQVTHLVGFSYEEDKVNYVPVYTVRQILAYETGVEKEGE